MTFRLKILGSNSAAPAFNRNQTAQVLQVNSSYFLIDCGEGTQLRMAKARVKINKISHIFISHLHGDHYFGLIGLISTMHLFGRKHDLDIFCPSPLEEIINLQLKHSETVLNFKINYTFIDQMEDDFLLENRYLTVEKFPLNHRIYCSGFLFREKPKPIRINKSKLPENFSVANLGKLKKGEDIYNEEGKLLYKNADLTLPPKHSRSYAYCSDTKYDENIIPVIKGVDLLYHEATFTKDMEERADNTYHSTAEQAGLIAKKAETKKLLIGHYSVRYRELEPLLEEARSVFSESYLAIEGNFVDVSDY
ncbi:MAG: ribonuclease Z [Cyclobacteriaceae bacterium]